MTEHVLNKELSPPNIPLQSLFLDPNNPRFVGSKTTRIPDDQIDKEFNQTAAMRMLVDNYGINKLRLNMEVNGYLPIDRIIVREFSSGKYVVLEGNRRVCAAKLINKYDSNGNVISPEVIESLQIIPCLIYTGSISNAAWIFQGLRHITGILEWSSFHKAKLLVEQMESESLSLTDVGRRFGLTAHGAGQWVRGYYAYRQASTETDYIEEIDDRAYPYFQEVFGRSNAPIREWLEWDERSYKFKNMLNLNEFTGWLYPKPSDSADFDLNTQDKKGDWSKRVIKTQDDIRNIAYLMKEAKKDFDTFRNELDLAKAYHIAVNRKYQEESEKTADRSQQVFESIDVCIKALDELPAKMLRERDTKYRLMTHLKKLKELIEALEN